MTVELTPTQLPPPPITIQFCFLNEANSTTTFGDHDASIIFPRSQGALRAGTGEALLSCQRTRRLQHPTGNGLQVTPGSLGAANNCPTLKYSILPHPAPSLVVQAPVSSLGPLGQLQILYF
ncbi:hypothetical protein GJAV_G00239900 [Gymnothorax javanicus]|nr:hypothetical protein GJAV_G00239900 [Gymnothorax javanicus]